MRFLADVDAGFEYIDNITYSDHDRLSDEVFRLALNLRALWDITRLNTLDVRLGIGFVRYIEHPEAAKGDVFITPGSQVAFDVYIADMFRLNFHDSFALLQDPVDTPRTQQRDQFRPLHQHVGRDGGGRFQHDHRHAGLRPHVV